MSSRGIIGFRVDGKDFLTYNHWDSQPQVTGQKVLDELKQLLSESSTIEIRLRVRKINLVGVNEKHKNDIAPGEQLQVGNRNSIREIVYSGIMSDDHAFINSDHCEWAYIVDLDRKKLEVYRGFWNFSVNYGRYQYKNSVRPIALLTEFDFSDLPDNMHTALENRVGCLANGHVQSPHLTLIRGLPGSGKSTLATQMLEYVIAKPQTNVHGKLVQTFHLETDMYFVDEKGWYQFDHSRLKEAHEWCQETTRVYLHSKNNVIVSNTFTTKVEIEPYINIAKNTGATIQLITTRGDYGNSHSVPLSTIKRMKDRWEDFEIDNNYEFARKT